MIKNNKNKNTKTYKNKSNNTNKAPTTLNYKIMRRKSSRKIGLWLMAMSVLVPALAQYVNYLTHVPVCNSMIKCGFVFEFDTVRLSQCGVMFVAGLLLILPISEWLSIWRKGSK